MCDELCVHCAIPLYVVHLCALGFSVRVFLLLVSLCMFPMCVYARNSSVSGMSLCAVFLLCVCVCVG